MRRISAQPVTALATVVVLWTSATLLAAAPMYGQAVATAGVRDSFATAPLRERAVELAAPVSAQTLDVFTAAVDQALTGLDADVARSLISESFGLDGREGELTVFAAYEGIERHASLLDGRWPGQASEVALPQGAALRLDLAPGDRLRLTSRRDAGRTVEVAVSGLYRADDPAAAYWWGQELEIGGVSEGTSFTTSGPLVLPAERLLQHSTDTEARWRALPDFSRVTVDDLGRLERAVAGLRTAVLEAEPEMEGLRTDSELPALLERVQRTATASRSGVLVATLLVAVLAGYGLVFIAGLLAERRRDESLLWLERGASAAQLVRRALAEAAVLAAPALLLATFSAQLAVRSVDPSLEPRIDRAVVLSAAVAGAVSIALLALPVARRARRGIVVTARVRGPGIVQRSGLDLALLGLALLGLWQLRQTEDLVSATLGVDPLLVLAPAIGLLAGAVIALRGIPGLARLAERAAARGRGLLGILSTMQLARRSARPARAALLLTLAIAVGVFAATFGRSWQRSQADQADHLAGGDLRVIVAAGTQDPGTAAALTATAGVRQVTPVAREPVRLAPTETVDALLLDAATASEVVRLRADLADGRLAALLAPLVEQRPALATVELPAAAATLALDLRTAVSSSLRTSEPLAATAVVRDERGVLHRLPSLELQASGSQRLEFALPGEAALALVAVEIRVPYRQVATGGAVELTGLGVQEAGRWSALPWQPERWRVRRLAQPDVDVPARAGQGLAFDVATSALPFGARTELYAATPGATRMPPALPVLAAAGFPVTDAAVELAGATLALTPVGTLRGFPTMQGEGIVVADLPSVAAAAYASAGRIVEPTEWWLAADDGTAAAITAATPGAEVVDGSVLAGRLRADPLSVGIAGALTLGFMAGAVLAALGFAVHAAISVEARRTEFAVLQSLGVSRRQQTLSLLAENAALILFSLLSGTLLGLAVARLALPSVIVTADGSQPLPGVLVDVPLATVATLEIVMLVMLVTVVAVQAGAAARLPVAQALRAAQER